MLKPGDVFDRYTIESILGEGGMGTVYCAEDSRLGRRVALKVVKLDVPEEAEVREATARLMREARAAAAFDHPNAVTVFDVGEHEGTTYIAMELVPGRTLRVAVGDRSIAVGERVRWLTDIARALAAAHRAGLVHRDVKPETVMVRDDGVVKVLDFGIARRGAFALDANAPTQKDAALGTLTSDGLRVGTPLYMAPEQIRGDAVDGRADQFAWGVVAYELLTGQVPWRKNDALALVATILTETPPRMRVASSDVPELVDNVVQRALAKSKDERFASMDDVVLALGATPSIPPEIARSGPRSGGSDGSSGGSDNGRRFSDDDIRRVVDRALQGPKRGETGTISYAELIDVGRQIGVDERALWIAANELTPAPVAPPGHPPSAARDAAIRKLKRNLAMYGIVNVFLTINDLRTWHIGFHYWLIVGWGFALALEAMKIYFPKTPWPLDLPRPQDPRAVTRTLRDGVTILRTARNRIAIPEGAARARIAPNDMQPASSELEADSDEAAAPRRIEHP
jgi:eukaryotic-like serine/threonine-protein kinase